MTNVRWKYGTQKLDYNDGLGNPVIVHKIFDQYGQVICTVGNEEQAKLIANAPEILDALRALCIYPDTWCACNKTPHTGECLQAQEALAKLDYMETMNLREDINKVSELVAMLKRLIETFSLEHVKPTINWEGQYTIKAKDAKDMLMADTRGQRTLSLAMSWTNIDR